jgi:hypothetical protein
MTKKTERAAMSAPLLSPEEMASAIAELERLARTHRQTVAQARRLGLDQRARESFNAWFRRTRPHKVLVSKAANARTLGPYVHRCLEALRAGRPPVSGDLVLGIARAVPTLGRLFAQGVRDHMGVPATAPTRFDAALAAAPREPSTCWSGWPTP